MVAYFKIDRTPAYNFLAILFDSRPFGVMLYLYMWCNWKLENDFAVTFPLWDEEFVLIDNDIRMSHDEEGPLLEQPFVTVSKRVIVRLRLKTIVDVIDLISL